MIRKIVNNLCQRFGEKIVWGNYVGHSFPRPERIAKSELSELTGCQLRYGKRQAFELREMARLVCNGLVDFEKLKEMNYQEAKAKLLSFDNGIVN